MSHIAQDNTKSAQDRAHFYANHNKYVPPNSKTLLMGNYVKLASHSCGPFIILTRIGSLVELLDLHNGVTLMLFSMFIT